MEAKSLTLGDREGHFCGFETLSNSHASGCVACNIYDMSIHLLQTFSNVTSCTAVQQLTRFQLT